MAFGVHRNTVRNWDQTGPTEETAKIMLKFAAVLADGSLLGEDKHAPFIVSTELDEIFVDMEQMRTRGYHASEYRTRRGKFVFRCLQLALGHLDDVLGFSFPQIEEALS